jgi:hypothetical protein
MGEMAFVPLCEAAKSLGVSRPVLRRLVSAGIVPVYQSHLDRRQKLLAAADLDGLRMPQVRERLVA